MSADESWDLVVHLFSRRGQGQWAPQHVGESLKIGLDPVSDEPEEVEIVPAFDGAALPYQHRLNLACHEGGEVVVFCGVVHTITALGANLCGVVG